MLGTDLQATPNHEHANTTTQNHVKPPDPKPVMEQVPFYKALEAADTIGKKISRVGWNGKNMWVAKVTPPIQDLPADKLWNAHARAHADSQGGSATVTPYYILKMANGEIMMGWTPNTADLSSQDWQVYDE